MQNVTVNQNANKQYMALDTAIKSLKEMLAVSAELYFNTLPFELYLKECKTVIAGAGRQTGKTHWIADHARKGDLVIAVNSLHLLQQALEESGIKPEEQPMLSTFRDIGELYYEKTSYRNVFIDDASYFFDIENRNEFYREIKDHCTKDTIIYLIG